jgi:hypothetical protein
MVNRMSLLRDPAAVQEKAPIPVVMSYLIMRMMVGVIAVLLPFVLLIANRIIGHGFQTSMSGYYYTPMRNVFVGALCAIGVFLASYDGYDRADRIITDLAGLSTVCVAFFPTAPVRPPGYQPTGREVLIGDLHLAFACTAFVLLSVMAFRFAKREPTPPGLTWRRRTGYAFGFTGPGDSQAPRWERIVYRASGAAILICIVLIRPLSAVTYSLLMLETIMLVSFGLSWFVKGRKILSGG